MEQNNSTSQRKAIKSYRGVVRRKSGDKTVRVDLSYQTRHPRYLKILKRRTVAHVHDENNVANVGDLVDIAKCRRMSRTKTWRLLRVVEADNVM
jgi:small subunit ribosomal protein S17